MWVFGALEACGVELKIPMKIGNSQPSAQEQKPQRKSRFLLSSVHEER